MAPSDHADDPTDVATTAETIVKAMMDLIDRREALASAFDAAIGTPPSGQDTTQIEELARHLDDCDRQIVGLLDRAVTVFAGPLLQAVLTES